MANKENFLKSIVKTENVLKFGRMRNMTIEGKVTAFKTLAVSKIMHLALVINTPVTVIKELNNIQKEFSWRCENPKIQQITLYNKFETGGRLNVDISLEIKSFKFS